ncbi:MAG: TonB-dependent receptor, partial [Pseudomonadales bacterium]|nr:TonB-dependent receptor [Pseudomonadales bacterium]
LDTVQLRWRDAWRTSTYYVDVNNPVYGQSQTLLDGEPSVTDRLEQQENMGLYFQDQIDLNAQFKVLLGVRFDDFSQEITDRSSGDVVKNEEDALSSRAGVVYQATDTMALYASFGEGFRPNSGSDFKGDAFEPEESESKEVGIKFDTIGGRLSTTVAVFQMEKSNVLTADPVNSGFSAALGAAESEGLEIDVIGNLTDSLHLLFNYAYVDAGTKTDLYNADWGIDIPAGSELVNIPQHQANLLLAKDLMISGRASSLGFSINYVSDRLGGVVDPISGQPSDFRLPSYTLFNAFGSHQLTDKVKVSLNIDNITNEKHYVSSYNKWWITPGAPMTWTVKGTYSF